MSFTFLHTADWQLGKRFGTLPAEIAPLAHDARLGAIDRIAALAAKTSSRHVLVAGDVFDTVTVFADYLGQTVARLAAYPAIHWHLLPGNHDPAQPGSVWQALASGPKHANISLHLTPAPVEIESGVVLLPAPLKTKAMSTDPTAYMDTITTSPGTLRIGLAHGSVRGFGSMGDAAVPIAPDRATLARLDYLALGDWHGLTRINDRTYYSGTPEPDRYKDNDAGETLAVSIAAAGALPVVTRHPTATYTWAERTIDLHNASRLVNLAAELRALGAPVKPILLALTLTGRVALSEAATWDEAIATVRNLTRHCTVDRTGLRFTSDAAELAAVFAGPLSSIAGDIAALQTTGTADEQRIASRALQLLAKFCRGTTS